MRFEQGKIIAHAVVQDSAAKGTFEGTFRAVSNLKELVEKYPLKAVYLHDYEYSPDKRFILVRRLEEHGDFQVPACPGIVSAGELDAKILQTLIENGYLSEIGSEADTKKFAVQTRFDGKEEHFRQSKLKDLLNTGQLHTAFYVLDKSRRGFRAVRLNELQEELISYLLSEGALEERDGQYRIVKSQQELEELSFPASFQLTEDEQKKFRERITQAAATKQKTCPKDAFKTRDPLAETLFDDNVQIISGEKQERNYKVRVGRFIISFVPRGGIIDKGLLSALIQLVQEKFLNRQREKLNDYIELLSLGLSRELQALENETLLLDNVSDYTNKFPLLVREAAQKIFLLGKEHCDMEYLRLIILPADQKYEDFKMSFGFKVLPGQDAVAVLPGIPLEVPFKNKRSADPHSRTFFVDKPLELHGLECIFEGTSASFNNFTQGGPNCFKVFQRGLTTTLANYINRLYTIKTSLEQKLDSVIDKMTGLYNKNFYNEQIKAWYEDYEKNRKNLGLIYLDMDNFKLVNDTLGHAAGDEFISWIGHTLLDTIILYNRSVGLKSHFAARLGGDEFGIVVNNDILHSELETKAIEVFKVLTEFPPQVTFLLEKTPGHQTKSFHFDLIAQFYNLFDSAAKESEDEERTVDGPAVKEEAPQRRPKRLELLSSFQRLLIKEPDSGRSLLNLINQQLEKLEDNEKFPAQIMAEGPLVSTLESLFSLPPNQEQLTKVRENIKDIMIPFMREQMLKVYQPILALEGTPLKKALEVFLLLQFDNDKNTDLLRKKMIKLLKSNKLKVPMRISLSMGVASADEERPGKDNMDSNINNLLASADSRMYVAKRTGRGRIVGVGGRPLPVDH